MPIYCLKKQSSLCLELPITAHDYSSCATRYVMVTSNLHKAAVLLSSLPKEQVARLLEQLEPEQVTAVTAEISRLRGIHEAERQTVAQEFAAASATHENNRPPAGTAPFQFLYEIPSDDLLELIADEHPQTVAVILAYLPPRQAAAVVAGLSPEGQLSVVSRIADHGPAEP